MGGIDAWREQNYPTETRNTNLADILLPPVSNAASDDLNLADPILKSVKVKPPTS
jgi:hypothetical protein